MPTGRLTMLVLALPATLAAAQPPAGRQAGLDDLAPFDGEWRGTAVLSLPNGSKREMTQTERVGPMLGGALRVIEGKALNADGSDAGFNAFSIVSPGSGGGYEFRAYAQGHAGTFPITLSPGAFDWSMPAGPNAVVHYTARIADGAWHEEGWYERDGKRLSKVFEMTLRRTGATDWPAGDRH